MANALSAMGGPPDAPNPQPMAPQPGNAMMGAGGPPQPGAGPQQTPPQPGAGPQQAPPPPPSHQQTVAALRHFDAIERELKTLLADPDVGKANLKSKIIDGTTTLVAQGIMTAAAAVTQLSTVPDQPFKQRQWLEQHLMQTVQASMGVLSHHAQAFAGQDVNSSAPGMDGHADMMAGLMKQYQGQPNG